MTFVHVGVSDHPVLWNHDITDQDGAQCSVALTGLHLEMYSDRDKTTDNHM